MAVCGRDHELKSLVVVESDCNVTPAPQLQVPTLHARALPCLRTHRVVLVQLPQSELDAIAGEGDMAEATEEDLAERKRRLATAREVRPRAAAAACACADRAAYVGVWQHATGQQRVGQLHHTARLRYSGLCLLACGCKRARDSLLQITDRIELDCNEAAFCCACVNFAQEQVVVVGTARDVVMSPRSCTFASLRTFAAPPAPSSCPSRLFFHFVSLTRAGRYRVVDGKLVLVHVTAMKEIPTALCGFKEHLIVGMAGAVRVYDWGRKQLLRKCESRDLPSTVLRIVARGNRLFAADQSESIFMLRFDAAANVISAFADDTTPRWATCVCRTALAHRRCLQSRRLTAPLLFPQRSTLLTQTLQWAATR